MTAELGLGFVLLEGTAPIDPQLVAEAGAALGVSGLAHVPSDRPDGPLQFSHADGWTLFVMPVAAPHPDAPSMGRGVLSPSVEAVEASPTHAIVTAMGLPDVVAHADALMARLVAAVVRSVPSVAAMLGHGKMFVRADVFADFVADTEPGELPVEVCVDITVAPDDGRLSLLSHSLPRYGREDFYVTCAPGHAADAYDFLLTMARWMVLEPGKQLPTGDTVGRTHEERLTVQRMANPVDNEAQVVRFDL